VAWTDWTHHEADPGIEAHKFGSANSSANGRSEAPLRPRRSASWETFRFTWLTIAPMCGRIRICSSWTRMGGHRRWLGASRLLQRDRTVVGQSDLSLGQTSGNRIQVVD